MDNGYKIYLDKSNEFFRNTAFYYTSEEWTCMDDYKGYEDSTCWFDWSGSWAMKGIYIGDYYWLSGVNSYVIG